MKTDKHLPDRKDVGGDILVIDTILYHNSYEWAGELPQYPKTNTTICTVPSLFWQETVNLLEKLQQAIGELVNQLPVTRRESLTSIKRCLRKM